MQNFSFADVRLLSEKMLIKFAVSFAKLNVRTHLKFEKPLEMESREVPRETKINVSRSIHTFTKKLPDNVIK